MTTPNIDKTAKFFKDIQPRFSPALWERVLTLINSSEKLKSQIQSIEKDISLTKATAIDDKGPIGAASFSDATGKSIVIIGASWFTSPEKFVGVLAHELGHYVNRHNDNSGWIAGKESGDPKNLQAACVSREGFAINNNIEIAEQIRAKTKTDIAIPGQKIGDDLVAMTAKLKSSYLASGASPAEATAAATVWLSGYNSGNSPSTSASETYGQWCLKEGKKSLGIAPAPVDFSISASIHEDGSTITTVTYATGKMVETAFDADTGTYRQSETDPVADTRTVSTDSDADGSWDDIRTETTLAPGITQLVNDTNADGTPDQTRFDLNGVFKDTSDFSQWMDVDYALHSARDQISESFYADYSAATSDFLLGSGAAFNAPPPQNPYNLDYNPIGAFYDSRSPAADAAASIAAKTPVILGAAGQSMDAASLTALDTNSDGMLSGAELSGLGTWSDLNENGIMEAGERQTLVERGLAQIKAADYRFYTAGNSRASQVTVPGAGDQGDTLDSAALPPRAAQVQPGPMPAPAAAPPSNYRSLRAFDNRFTINANQWIDWTATMIKISSDQKTLVGTDGNDIFDGRYYASYAQYFNIALIANFVAGDGDDLMGGSDRDDALWGGTGDDTVEGYAGNDRLFGEEGNDQLEGGAGNDHLDGGIGADLMFGGAGNDTLNGGDGNDTLVGSDSSSELRQALDAPGADNDAFYGGAGNDTVYAGMGHDAVDGGSGNDILLGQAGHDVMFGGLGNDELEGGEGNDSLLGDAGDDKLFGQVGNDSLWGGDGDDILIGFTASNEAKQSLNAGETDDDTLFGGRGMDNLYGDFGNDFLDGGDDADLLVGNEGDDTLYGAAGNDEVQGSDGNDRLLGEAGDDRMFGQTGDDRMWGGSGNDIMLGFTAVNEAKQALQTGETDNDAMHGGAGNDLMLGGLGDDALHGDAGADELQGGMGNDMLYGGDANDRLFGQAGNDVIYGGVGDDLILGSTAFNEVAPDLASGQTDNNWLYGGSGNDTLVGGAGSDYLDGGAGADLMEGGSGNDIYVVNSVNDEILERADEGHDVVISSANYLLNNGIEELRLVEGLDIHGTGNALDNRIIGNSRNNILDGVDGKDTMLGGAGNDTYYVDNAGDQVMEAASEGIDTVQSLISHTLGAHVENLNLLDFSKPEKGLVDGTATLVYGYPKRNELDYMQGDAMPDYLGTCALTSIANLLTQSQRPTTEAQVVQVAIDNHWAVTDPGRPAHQRGGSNFVDQQNILDSYGVRNDLLAGYNEQGVANLVRSGRGVIIAVNAGVLWGEAAYAARGEVNHAVTVTGAVYGEASGELMGFYIADSGRQMVSDMTRFVGIDQFRAAANVPSAYAIYTLEPLKLWDEDIDGRGNALDNVIVGNRGENLLAGGHGNDTLNGGAGNDIYAFERGDGIDTIEESDVTVGNADTLRFGRGIAAEQIWFARAGNDLELSVIGTADKMMIAGWYLGKQHHVERFETADGKTLLESEVQHLADAMAGFSPPAAGQITLPTNHRNDLATVIAANWH